MNSDQLTLAIKYIEANHRKQENRHHENREYVSELRTIAKNLWEQGESRWGASLWNNIIFSAGDIYDRYLYALWDGYYSGLTNELIFNTHKTSWAFENKNLPCDY